MISEYLGFDSDYIILGMLVVVLIMFIMLIVNMVKTSNLKKKYKTFMSGKNARSLEDTLIKRLNQIDNLIVSNDANERNINHLFEHIKFAFQKIGMVKYDAFHEMGGKLSFSLALLNETDDGFIINAVHSREGCYTYIKEIIGGNSIIALSDEEEEALEMAKKSGMVSSKKKK